MKSKSFAVTRTLAVCALVIALVAFSFAQDKPKAPQVSKGEQDAMTKVQTAADPAAKLKAADEFIKKYPKSTNRAVVVSQTVGTISNVADQTQKITLLESSLTVFKDPADSDVITPVLLNSGVVNSGVVNIASSVSTSSLSLAANSVSDLRTTLQPSTQATRASATWRIRSSSSRVVSRRPASIRNSTLRSHPARLNTK